MYKGMRAGEIKIIELPNVAGGITTEVLTLSRNSFFKTIIFVGEGNPNSSIETVKTHELGHAREHHGIFLELILLFLFSMIYGLIWFIVYNVFFFQNIIHISLALIIKMVLITISISIIVLLLYRVLESRADAFTFRNIGERAYNDLINTLQAMYGVTSTEDAPLWSRLTHTSSRSALKTGDALSSLNIWEFPVVLSLIESTILMIPFTSSKVIGFLFPLSYVGFLVITFLLGTIFFPILKGYYGKTTKGGRNFSFLLAGIYVFMSECELLSFPNIYLVILQFVLWGIFAFLVIKVFIKSKPIKVFLITLFTYLSINALVGTIWIVLHHGV
ncbi:M48 family metalloprotease [Sulfolobus sp. E11-6]|uniref:M48 family metalloprotease n=1 Tax=Sulfolobus sp. E11-6 TaxID=2663020 RepID=UPI001296D50A|nr:M48 family metalloprotease [Sulfolobus sp. E11-6]QGA69512.1 M48 family metalloprotease [Sulfolobus sp. E11-6]